MSTQDKIEQREKTLQHMETPAEAHSALVLDDGSVFLGKDIPRENAVTCVGELCFNTAMTGYQEIMTDPSYAGQIITFTFPHIGIVGANPEDIEGAPCHALGLVTAQPIETPSNYRAHSGLSDWVRDNKLGAISQVDTRRLTRLVREQGAPNAALFSGGESTSRSKDHSIDLVALYRQAREWPGLDGMDLASTVSTPAPYEWSDGLWESADGSGRVSGFAPPAQSRFHQARFHVVAIDYGIKRNILRHLTAIGCRITVVPWNMKAADILALQPDGIFLSNGPGDPAATAAKIMPILKDLLASGLPVFGICLGFQMMALALGAKTEKMRFGHHGANHPIHDHTTQKVEVTSQNHGFAVPETSLPDGAEATHISLFDGTLAGFRLSNKPVFGVQYHPEASPGPQDSRYLFHRFAQDMAQNDMAQNMPDQTPAGAGHNSLSQPL